MRCLLVLAIAAGACAAPTLKPKRPDDAKAILGMWMEESRSTKGVAGQGGAGGLMFRFDADGTGRYGSDVREKGGTPMNYTLNQVPSPRRLNWTGAGEYTLLYQLDGDKLILAFPDQRQEPPAKIEPSPSLTIYYCKRVKE